MKVNPHVQDWNKICNMRSTLLHLQFLYCSISQQIQAQQNNFKVIHKDRLIQYYDLCKKTHELASNNFKLVLIAKLQSLLSLYAPIDDDIWNSLTQFINCVKYLQQQMTRDVSKLYIGQNLMIDIGKCQKQLKIIQEKIVAYMEENQSNINQYNNKIEQIQKIEQLWGQYLKQITLSIKTKIQPHYARYLRKKLQRKQKQLINNIKILQQFIRS